MDMFYEQEDNNPLRQLSDFAEGKSLSAFDKNPYADNSRLKTSDSLHRFRNMRRFEENERLRMISEVQKLQHNHMMDQKRSHQLEGLVSASGVTSSPHKTFQPQNFSDLDALKKLNEKMQKTAKQLQTARYQNDWKKIQDERNAKRRLERYNNSWEVIARRVMSEYSEGEDVAPPTENAYIRKYPDRPTRNNQQHDLNALFDNYLEYQNQANKSMGRKDFKDSEARERDKAIREITDYLKRDEQRFQKPKMDRNIYQHYPMDQQHPAAQQYSVDQQYQNNQHYPNYQQYPSDQGYQINQQNAEGIQNAADQSYLMDKQYPIDQEHTTNQQYQANQQNATTLENVDTQLYQAHQEYPPDYTDYSNQYQYSEDMFVHHDTNHQQHDVHHDYSQDAMTEPYSPQYDNF